MPHSARPDKQASDEYLPGLLDEASRMPADDPRRRAASIAMFDRVAQHWRLDGEERQRLLGGVTKSTWSDWKRRPPAARIRPDTRERIANLFAIDMMTHSIFAPEFADAWVRRPHPSFGDESALAIMVRGKIEDIVSVRRHLESVGAGAPPATPSLREVTPEVAGTPDDGVRSWLKTAIDVALLEHTFARLVADYTATAATPDVLESRLRATTHALGAFLADHALLMSDHVRALAIAESLVRLDPLDERAWEIAIRAHLAAGDPGHAMREYRRYAALLSSELDVEPPADLKRLLETG